MSQRVIMPAATGWLVGVLAGQLTEPVGSGIPTNTDRFVKVLRTGGPADTGDRVTDVPQFAVECYARWEDEAETFAEDVRSRIHALAGTTANGVNVKRVLEYGGPGILPDPRTPELSRVTFTVAIRLRGTIVDE